MKETYKPDHLLGKRYPKDWAKEDLEEFASNTTTRQGITIPVNVEIKADQKVFDYSALEEILKRVTKYAVIDCKCRTTLENCDAPKDVCLTFDEAAEKTVESGERNARFISYDEALDAVKRAQESGLVHMAYIREGKEYPSSVCGCCTCCCGILGGILRFGVNSPIKLVTSDKIASYNSDACIGCGVCFDRCHFDAWEINGNKPVCHAERCYGCGNCATTCPSQAVHMINRH